MRKIRILYTIPNFDTAGSGIALMKLVTGLDRKRFEPMIVCLHDRGAYFKTVRESGVPVHIYPYLSPLKPRLALVGNVIRISRFFRRLAPDIVFSYHYSSDFSEALAARLAGCRFMYIKKNMGWNGPSRNQWRIKTMLSDAITVQNTDMMRDFFHRNPKAVLVSVGVDTEEFKPRPPATDLKRGFGIPDASRIVMCVANIIPKKGIDYLLRGFAESSSRDGSFLIIVGDDDSELGRSLHALRDELGLGGRCIFTGKRSDVKDLMSIADLFILPSTGNEGAPLAVQEAMASGIIVVTTDTPGNRDQLSELPDQLIPVKDHLSIATAIDRYLGLGEELRSEILETQHRTIETRYSLRMEVERHEQLYLKTMKASR